MKNACNNVTARERVAPRSFSRQSKHERCIDGVVRLILFKRATNERSSAHWSRAMLEQTLKNFLQAMAFDLDASSAFREILFENSCK